MNRIIEIPAELSVPQIGVEAEVSAHELDVGLKIGVALRASPDVYAGTTVIVPGDTDQTLETEGLLMPDDVSVKKIPFMEVSNSKGGKTATIGG